MQGEKNVIHGKKLVLQQIERCDILKNYDAYIMRIHCLYVMLVTKNGFEKEHKNPVRRATKKRCGIQKHDIPERFKDLFFSFQARNSNTNPFSHVSFG